ncbi:MAG: ribose 5-phosphate isomerase A [Vicinamibacteria bacterium]|nr:ribose 5-phosphate isomerase A [Vicinamibacteria bacterium]
MADSDQAAELKRRAAHAAVDRIESGMTVGLGTGSTAVHAIREIGRRMREGALRNVVGIPTSRAAERAALEADIPLMTLAERPIIDVTIDGADEFDPRFNVIKGMGGALLWEKIVAQVTRQWIIVADAGKRVTRLGTRSPLPVEVVRFGWTSQRAHLESLGARAELRHDEEGHPYLTDEGHYIIHCSFDEGILDPHALAQRLRSRAGIVEHGMFLGMASEIVIGAPSGIEVLRRA